MVAAAAKMATKITPFIVPFLFFGENGIRLLLYKKANYIKIVLNSILPCILWQSNIRGIVTLAILARLIILYKKKSYVVKWNRRRMCDYVTLIYMFVIIKFFLTKT
jgi:hypothetical protein